jgi:hypothetical protein
MGSGRPHVRQLDRLCSHTYDIDLYFIGSWLLDLHDIADRYPGCSELNVVIISQHLLQRISPRSALDGWAGACGVLGAASHLWYWHAKRCDAAWSCFRSKSDARYLWDWGRLICCKLDIVAKKDGKSLEVRW